MISLSNAYCIKMISLNNAYLENMTPLVIRLNPAIQMFIKTLQKPSWTALGFLSQKIKMYLLRMEASSRRRICHLYAFLRTDWMKQKMAGWGPKKYLGISNKWIIGTSMMAAQQTELTSLFINFCLMSSPKWSYQMIP